MPTARSAALGARDWSGLRRSTVRWRPLAAAAFAGFVLAALALSTLRNQIIDRRYRLAEAVREERALLEQQREATVSVRRLRDPKRLAKFARERGFVRPERVIDLVRPGTSGGAR